ncbi:MAG: GerMN domain-containing protein [Bacilli bacterium]|nr:GerMN domain-containing protein [Bacilli bacterium]MDD4298080.1 GerMN domain-containing protein [Bacilli bacterium]MDD4643455.1 GerMN domain-containing protein [Bacilli bacterium]
MIIDSVFKRIALASVILLLLLLFSLFPKEKEYELNVRQNIEYVSQNNTSEIYLLDDNNFISRTSIILNGKTVNNKIREIIDILIIDGKRESVIPSGFRAVLPSDTKLISIELTNKIAKINLSKALLDVNKEMEEKVIEAITYSLTGIEGVEGILIYIEGQLLTKLPQTGKILPPVLKRDFGVNKIYDFDSLSNITDVTIYYINQHNDKYYYVPVTKYTNDNRDKIKIIIDELTSGPLYETNLMSFLNTNAKLLNYELKDKTLILNFNSYLFDDIKNKKILEEVIYSIALSVGVNYDVKEVIFMVENEEIEKSTIGGLE